MPCRHMIFRPVSTDNRRKRGPLTVGLLQSITRRLPLVCGFLLASWSTLSAQNVGKISGVVKDAETGEPLLGCNVMVSGTTLGASSDPEGTFFILNIPPGKYDIQASLVGYQKVMQRGAIVHSGRTTTVDFSLRPEDVVGQEIVIEAARPDVEREKTSTSAIVRAEDVQLMAGIRDVGDVLTLAADVTDGHFRGGRTGEEYYALQGLGIVNPLDNSSAFLPIMSAVEEVEVITSGFGAQYGNAQSGVVNISMKEGKRSGWTTRVDGRMRAPTRKHFGPSVFDPGANPYLALLLNPDVWLRGDPNSETGQSYYSSMGSGLTRYAGDTLVWVAVAQALYLQTRRDINRNYGKNLDYSLETATGGPVDDNMRMFIALRSNVEWPVFPTEQPDIEQQVMGNLVIDLSATSALRISGGFTQEETNAFPGTNSTSGYRRWLWDRITGIRYQKRTNLQLGARFTKTLSQRTFYEIKLNSLFTKNVIGSTPVPNALADSIAYGSGVGWSFILPVSNNNSPDGINYQAGYDEFREEPTRTLTLDGSMTSQITGSHMVNAGLQINAYAIDVSNVLQLRNNDYIERYKAYPFETGLYVQDKMEFEGFIANAGLRFDLWSSGKDYYTNTFTPFLDLDPAIGRYNPDAAPREKTPLIGRLQPRVGVSFPVSVNTVFHINYGSFMQRPPFQYVVRTQIKHDTGEPVVLGNPRLEPQVTNSYDVGVTQGLGEGFTLDVSGYYKDVKNLIEQAFFSNEGGLQYSSYFNRDYADIRGFRVALSKRRGAFTGSANYQFGVATGKSANATSASPMFTRLSDGTIQTDLSHVPIRDITLDFDVTHNVILTLAYTTAEEWGPEFLGGRPFADLTLSSQSYFRSGRPYTSPSSHTLINAQRTPGQSNTNIRLTKRIRNLVGTGAAVYVEVFNLFDTKILNYDYLFGNRPSGTNQNLPLEYYETYGVDDPNNGVRYWYDKGSQPFAIDQSFLVYENQPRSVSFGFTLEF